MRTSILKRGARWRARYYHPTEHKWESSTWDRKVDAEKWVRDELGNIDAGRWVDPKAGNTLFADVSDRWMAGRVALRDSTRARDRSLLSSLVLPHLGPRPVMSVKPSDLEAWLAVISQSRAPATVRKAYDIAAGVFKLAVRDRLIAVSPARDIDLPTANKTERRFLTMAEVDRILEAIDPRFKVMVLTAVHSGLRVGELAGLKVDAVDVMRGSITVSRQLVEVNGRVTLGPPKTAASRRRVAIPRFLADELAAHIAENPNDEGWVFTSPEGGPVRRTGFRNRFWKPAVERVGLAGVAFHCLRHTHASWLISQGVHVKALQVRLGHSSAQVTMDVYSHILPSLDDALVDGLERAWTERDRVAEADVIDIRRTAGG